MAIYDEIKNRVQMKDLLASYGINPVRGTNIYRCIFHEDRKPSANIIKNCEKFHCFSCQYSGDIFDIVEHFEKCNRKEALKILDSRFNLGLMKQLTHKEKLALAREQREREKAKAEKLAWEKFEKDVRHQIVCELEKWAKIQQQNHLTRGEYKNGTWSQDKSTLFFMARKKQDWLNWLYNAICGFDHPECEFDYTHPFGKRELLEKIRKGEIEVW